MADDLKGRRARRANPEQVGPPRQRFSRTERAKMARARKRRRNIALLAVCVLLGVVLAAAVLGTKMFSGFFGGTDDDYAGDGKNDVVVQVHDGDSTTAIAQTLVDKGVVATVGKFVEAARSTGAISAIQPGFYKMRTELPASAAVKRLADPANRVGKLTIPEGRQLDDITDLKTNDVTDGIFTLISKATCVTIDGAQKCVSADDLRTTAGTAALQLLNVPAWATERVTAMGDDHRRLEGLIAPGTWNVDPAGTPQQILADLISASAGHYTASGLLNTANAMNMSPYDILVVASLVQKEAKPADFTKVARVIYNRLAVPQKLEFDSTVNYPLDRQEIATTDADRAAVTPWNTYASEGLPATPISSPGDDALAAAERPEPGDWLYFVTIDAQGTTLFTRDYQQHLANIELARRNGILDSVR